MASKSTISGFKTIKVKFDKNTDAYHVMYLKSHSVREENKRTPNGRTLFVLNVPPYCTKPSLRNVFGCCGAIQNVYIRKHPGAIVEKNKSFFNSEEKPPVGFKVGYIVFKKEASIQNALQLDCSEIRYFSTEEKPVETGINKWCKEYASNYPNPKKLQKEIDEFMEKFDKKQAEEKEEAKRLQSQPDEEGWITIGKGGRKPGASKVDAAELMEKKKRKQKQQLYFYNFQQRETRREHIAQLRKKFEEDKQKVAKMKSARKFRPY